jgi:MFS family permease
LLIPAGRAADRWGRRRIWATGMVVFLLSSATCAGATSLALLIGARVAQAAGVAILMPSSLALLLPAFPAAKRASATGLREPSQRV